MKHLENRDEIKFRRVVGYGHLLDEEQIEAELNKAMEGNTVSMFKIILHNHLVIQTGIKYIEGQLNIKKGE